MKRIIISVMFCVAIFVTSLSQATGFYVIPVKKSSEKVAFDAQSVLPPQSLPSGFTLIELPEISFNYGSGYSESMSQFNAPFDGIYQFNANVSLDTGGQSCPAFILSLFLNGNEFRRLARSQQGGQFELSGSTLMKVHKGDVVDIRVYHTCANPIVVEANGKAYFSGIRLYDL